MMNRALLWNASVFLLAVGIATITIPSSTLENHERNPLIFVSSSDSIDNDSALRRELGVDPSYPLSFGENLISGKRYLIIKADGSQLNSYTSISQLGKFIIRNSEHARGGKEARRTFQEYIDTLFYSPDPLDISCGQVSSLFRRLAESYLGVERRHTRYINMYGDKSLDPTSIEDKYLQGGHTVLEIYFPELKKWAVFDLDKGVMPSFEGAPLSMIDIHLLKAHQIAFVPQGHDSRGKGPDSALKTNNYYLEARSAFGIPVGESYIFLFSKLDSTIEVFRKNFETSYKRRVEIITDYEAYRGRFYHSPN